MSEVKKKDNKKSKTVAGRCEDCMYYDYDEYLEMHVCTLNLDEDEMVSFLTSKSTECKYYKYYDEYKFVRHQN